MADGMTAADGAQYAEGAHSQVVYRDGVWWHWRIPTPTFPAWVPVTGHDPLPTKRMADVDATRARIERTVRRTVTQ